MKYLIRFLPLTAAIALFAWAAVDYFRPPDGPGFAIEPADYRPDPAPAAGTETTVTLQAVNRSAHPIRIVGLKTC